MARHGTGAADAVHVPAAQESGHLTTGHPAGPPEQAALLSSLPLERAGAGSAVTNTVRQTGSLLGIAVGDTMMSITYRRGIEPRCTISPARYGTRPGFSAEQARHAATAFHRPALAACRR
ncbi:hypothetical protein ABZ826_23085 [Streptomyces sp. NPDC047515]|uniref:hypothetical protein n=1 Tax=Streptomyces sp. NPDC047515 TaxID=3155380 RepID=UPI003407C229